jgi:predicted benzoate:H+ symporter BenE
MRCLVWTSLLTHCRDAGHGENVPGRDIQPVWPALLIQAVAGLAPLGCLASALTAALSKEHERILAVITFIAAASGVSFSASAPLSGS